MQLASKESDIEQLRAKLLDLSDSTSVASFPSADETDGNLPGKKNSILSIQVCLNVMIFFFPFGFLPLCHLG
jgi:hypothetical protein